MNIHDRWVADPIVKEVLLKHEEEIKRAGHQFSDKPIPDIVSKGTVTKLKKKPVRLIEAPKFEESFTEKKTLLELRSQKPTDYDNDSDYIPTSKIETMLNKYAKDIEEEEKFYQDKIEEHKQKAITNKEELKAITADCVAKRPILQDKFERVKPNPNSRDEGKTRPTTEDDWLLEYTREAYYLDKNRPQNQAAQEHKASSSGSLGGGFNTDLNKSNRSKRQKWNKGANNAIMSTNVDQKLNSKTAAQLDRLANIQVEASKQDMIINEMYTKIKEQEKIDNELKTHIKPKKDKVKRQKPVPNVPKNGLFSVENWLSKIDGEDPEVIKERLNEEKKLKAKKVSKAVERLSKPQEKPKPRRDPVEEELKHILNIYDTSEVRIGGGGKKKFEYKNPVPGSKKSPLIFKKNVNFLPNPSQGSTNDNDNGTDEEYSQYLLSNIHREEQKLQRQRQQLDTMMTQKSQLQTNKISEHNTLVDNAFHEILGDTDTKTLIRIPEKPGAKAKIPSQQSDEEFRDDEKFENEDDENIDFNEREELPTLQIDKRLIDDIKYVKEQAKGLQIQGDRNNTLSVPSRKSPTRSSKDSLNDRTELNRDLEFSEDKSDWNERDIDLEEQYEQMINGKGIEEIERDSDDSLNDVDPELTELYTGM